MPPHYCYGNTLYKYIHTYTHIYIYIYIYIYIVVVDDGWKKNSYMGGPSDVRAVQCNNTMLLLIFSGNPGDHCWRRGQRVGGYFIFSPARALADVPVCCMLTCAIILVTSPI